MRSPALFFEFCMTLQRGMHRCTTVDTTAGYIAASLPRLSEIQVGQDLSLSGCFCGLNKELLAHTFGRRGVCVDTCLCSSHGNIVRPGERCVWGWDPDLFAMPRNELGHLIRSKPHLANQGRILPAQYVMLTRVLCP